MLKRQYCCVSMWLAAVDILRFVCFLEPLLSRIYSCIYVYTQWVDIVVFVVVVG